MEDKLAYFRGWRDACYDVGALMDGLSETASAGAGVSKPCTDGRFSMTKNLYRVRVQVRKTWLAEGDVTVEVEAETEADARGLAEDEAEDLAALDKFDADLDEVDTNAYAIELLRGEGETPRCDKTPDMFT